MGRGLLLGSGYREFMWGFSGGVTYIGKPCTVCYVLNRFEGELCTRRGVPLLWGVVAGLIGEGH